MGLFDFAKDVGRQLFDTDAEAADNIRQHLDIQLSGIKNLDVAFDDGVATICGDCASEATRNNAILIAGDVKGVERIIADDLKFPEPVEEEKEKFDLYQEILRQGIALYANP
jgi:hypothetical protein